MGVETRASATLCGPARGVDVVGTVNDPAAPTEALAPATFSLAVARLVATDPVLSGVVERWGPPPFWRHPQGFAGLVHGILAQQVSLESTLATSGLTALQALRDVAKVQPGQSVLITGASGGVGSFAVQIAKGMGAEVTGVCSTRNEPMVRALGADHVIAYTDADFTRAGRLYDVIIDNVEAQPLADARRALAPRGTLIPNSGAGGRWFGPLGRILAAHVRSRFTRQHLRPFLSLEKHEDLLALAALVEAGTVTPVVDRTYPLERAADALAYVGEGHARGKVVVAVDATAPATNCL